MARFLSNGILTSISIQSKKRCPEYDIIKAKDEILKELNKYIDTSKYEIYEREDNRLYLEVKEEFCNEHLHDLMKELSPVTECDFVIENLFRDEYPELYKPDFLLRIPKMNYENFNSQTYQMKIIKHGETCNCEKDSDNCHKGKLSIKSKTGEVFEELTWGSSEGWLFKENEKLSENVTVFTCFILFWLDPNHIEIEDESNTLYLLNKFSRNEFQNPLAKTLIFFIYN